MAPEGHRPRPPGLDPRAPLDRRRHRLRPDAAQLRRQGQPQGPPAGVPRRAARPRRARLGRGSWTRPAGTSPSTKRGRRVPAPGARTDSPPARCSWSSRTSHSVVARSFRNIAGVYVLAGAELETVDVVATRSLLVERAVWERITRDEPTVEAVSPEAQAQARRQEVRSPAGRPPTRSPTPRRLRPRAEALPRQEGRSGRRGDRGRGDGRRGSRGRGRRDRGARRGDGPRRRGDRSGRRGRGRRTPRPRPPRPGPTPDEEEKS